MKKFLFIFPGILVWSLFVACNAVSNSELNPFELPLGLMQSDFKHGWGKDCVQMSPQGEPTNVNKDLIKWKRQ
ncbi:MAG: hypothetical protein IJP75_01980 [Bacteroidaceae bacterium]|nr:hypothetical protein [Bacteroidaceae bacterium]